MEAVISGQAGVALLVDGDVLSSIHVHAPDEIIPRRPTEYHFLFGGANDLRFLEDVELDVVQGELETAAQADDALHLLLIALDAESPGEIRSDAMAELDDVLAGDDVRERLERLLFAHPLPESADPTGVLELSASDRSSQFIRRLLTMQLHVANVFRAWQSIDDAAFVSDEANARFQFHAAAVNDGLFRELVLCAAKQQDINVFLLHALQLPSVKTIPNHRQIVQEWAAPFRVEKTLEASWVREDDEVIYSIQTDFPGGVQYWSDIVAVTRTPSDPLKPVSLNAASARISTSEVSMTKTRVALALMGNGVISLDENQGIQLIPNDQIHQCVDRVLQATGLARESIQIQCIGDGAFIVLGDSETAQRFAQAVHQVSEEFNTSRTVESANYCFRIAATTGDVVMRACAIAGITIANAVWLKSAGEPGQVLEILATFDTLPPIFRKRNLPHVEISANRDRLFSVHSYVFLDDAAVRIRRDVVSLELSCQEFSDLAANSFIRELAEMLRVDASAITTEAIFTRPVAMTLRFKDSIALASFIVWHTNHDLDLVSFYERWKVVRVNY